MYNWLSIKGKCMCCQAAPDSRMVLYPMHHHISQLLPLGPSTHDVPADGLVPQSCDDAVKPFHIPIALVQNLARHQQEGPVCEGRWLN